MRKKGLLKKLNKKVYIFLLIITLLLCGCFSYLNYVVNPIIIESSSAKVRSLSQDAINTAVFEVIKDSTIYDTLIHILRNEEGEIIMISSNSVQINSLSRDIIENAQLKLEKMGASGVNIPVGTSLACPFFVGKGPSVKLRLLPIGTINCSFSSRFVTAGINQTNHRIYIEVSTKVNVILPTASEIVNTKTQIMIAENIIIGKVPQTYLNSSEVSDMLNLVP